MAQLTVVEPNKFGVPFVMEEASDDEDGDSFRNDGRTILIVTNADTEATRTLTFTPTATPKGLTITPIVVEVGEEETVLIGPFRPRYFNNGAGEVTWEYDDETDLTIGAIRVR